MTEDFHVGIGGALCESCGGSDFVRHSQGEELVCTDCGHVIIAQKVEEGPEWRSFEDEEESRIRVGMPPTLLMQDKGLSTVIGSENHDSSGKRIVGRTKRDMGRLRKWQHRISTHTSKERNLAQALSKLNKLGEKLDLSPNILERTAYVYRMALEMDLIRGRSIDSIIVASLYVAVRYDGIPRTLKEISEASGIPKEELARDYRLLVKELRLRMPVVDPVKHIRRICSKAELNKRVLVEAEKIVRLAEKKRMTAGKDPIALAAASTYYACILTGVNKTQSEISDASEITEVTVRNRFKALEEELQLDGPVEMDLLKAP